MTEPSLVVLLTLAIVTVALHVIEYAWVFYQVNVRAPARTQSIVHSVLDDRLPKFAEELKPKLMRGGVDPLQLVDRREFIKAEKQARKDATRGQILAWLTQNWGEVIGPMTMKFLDANEILGDGLLLAGDSVWQPVIAKVANALASGKTPKEDGGSKPYVNPFGT